MDRGRFNLDRLDPDDPFEIDDGNWPHILKHAPQDEMGRQITISPGDLIDLYFSSDTRFTEADLDKGDADWLMIGRLSGIVVSVPLAPPNDEDVRFCRPIGFYSSSREERTLYLRGDDDE